MQVEGKKQSKGGKKKEKEVCINNQGQRKLRKRNEEKTKKI